MRATLRALLATTMVLLLTGSVFAQAINMMRDEKRRTQDDVERDQAIEKDYNAQMKKIPDQKQSSDPWGTVRSSDTTKQAPATAAKKPKQN